MRREYQVSQRHACILLGVDPKTVRRERPPDHVEIRAEMREIAATRRRFGYRRVGVLLERKGHVMNHKKLGTSKNVLIFCIEACWVRRGSARRVMAV